MVCIWCLNASKLYNRIDLKVPGDNNVDDASAADYAAVGDYEDLEPAVKKKRGDRGSRRKKKAGGLFIKKLISWINTLIKTRLTLGIIFTYNL